MKQDNDIDGILRETRYFTDRWHMSASTVGLVWFRPVAARFTPEDLAGLLALMRQSFINSCRDNIKFDFSDSRVTGEQWTLVEALLKDFAETIGADLRLSLGNSRRSPAALITWRQSTSDDGRGRG
jgi:hypothetical protein